MSTVAMAGAAFGRLEPFDSDVEPSLSTWNGCNCTSRLTVSKPREASAGLLEHYQKESLCFVKDLVVIRSLSRISWSC